METYRSEHPYNSQLLSQPTSHIISCLNGLSAYYITQCLAWAFLVTCVCPWARFMYRWRIECVRFKNVSASARALACITENWKYTPNK